MRAARCASPVAPSPPGGAGGGDSLPQPFVSTGPAVPPIPRPRTPAGPRTCALLAVDPSTAGIVYAGTTGGVFASQARFARKDVEVSGTGTEFVRTGDSGGTTIAHGATE